MPRACNVCADRVLAATVDQQLGEGRSVRDVAAFTGRSKSAIGRHAAHGNDERNERGVLLTPKAPKKKPPARRATTAPPTRTTPRSVLADLSQTGHEPIETRGHLVQRFQSLLDEAMAILTEARRRRDNRLALASLKEARESIVSIGKALGLIQPDGATFVDQRRQTLQVLGGLSEQEMRDFIAATVGDRPALPSSEAVEAVVIDGAFETPADSEVGVSGA